MPMTARVLRAQKSGAINNFPSLILSHSPSSPRPPPHLSDDVFFVVTRSDWIVFKDKRKPWDVEVGRCMWRLNMIGVTHPSCQTSTWCVAMLILAHYEVLPSHDDIFKTAAEAERRFYPYGHVVHYPQRPHDLSDVTRVHACEEGAPPFLPPSWSLCGIRHVAENHIFLRSNSKFKRQKETGTPKETVSLSEF